MTMLSASRQSLALYEDEFLQSLERSVRRWARFQGGDEQGQLVTKILKRSHQLVLLERFLKKSRDASNEGSISLESSAEKLQKVCKALVREKGDVDSSGKQRCSEKLEKLLIHFYRLFYRMLSKSFSYLAIPH
jgi:hypothetical protein